MSRLLTLVSPGLLCGKGELFTHLARRSNKHHKGTCLWAMGHQGMGPWALGNQECRGQWNEASPSERSHLSPVAYSLCFGVLAVDYGSPGPAVHPRMTPDLTKYDRGTSHLRITDVASGDDICRASAGVTSSHSPRHAIEKPQHIYNVFKISQELGLYLRDSLKHLQRGMLMTLTSNPPPLLLLSKYRRSLDLCGGSFFTATPSPLDSMH